VARPQQLVNRRQLAEQVEFGLGARHWPLFYENPLKPNRGTEMFEL
jgi:hypothetical protein